MNEKTNALARMNDQLRRTGLGGKVLITSGVQSLSHSMQARLLQAIASFDNFAPDDDPYGEHDFGAVDFDGTKFFWKIDYYDQSYEGLSPDPLDAQVTRRVMTVMRADEY